MDTATGTGWERASDGDDPLGVMEMELVTQVWEFAVQNPWAWMAAVGTAVVVLLAWAVRISAY